MHREGDPWSGAHAQLAEAMASLQFRVRGLDARPDLVLLFELRRCLLLSSLSDCHVGNFEREDAPVAATLDRTLVGKRAGIAALGRKDGQPQNS